MRGIIRNLDHAQDLQARGAEPVLADMEAEDDLAPFVEGADAIVFAAGAGPAAGRRASRRSISAVAVKLIDAAQRLGIDY